MRTCCFCCCKFSKINKPAEEGDETEEAADENEVGIEEEAKDYEKGEQAGPHSEEAF